VELKHNCHTETGWDITEYEFEKEMLITSGSNYMIGNGYLGYRGTFPEWGPEQYVGCIVTDTYDLADGRWKELCNVPNSMYITCTINGAHFDLFTGEIKDYKRSLNFRYGIHSRDVTWKKENTPPVRIHDERFASYNNVHLIPSFYSITAEQDMDITIKTGIDGNVWSLHGDHFSEYSPKQEGNILLYKTITKERKLPIYVAEGITIHGVLPKFETIDIENKQIVRTLKLTVKAGESIVIEKIGCIYTQNDVQSPKEAALETLAEALNKGYDTLKKEHTQVWDKYWQHFDITIEGDENAQMLLRYNIYHNMIATPSHTDHLPIGARGLSCQAYQGAAFWDQEIFNIPMFFYTIPEIARNILVYRHKTIEGARKKAKDLGYYGAYYAWISGESGEELCPSFFFKDVLTGRSIHNHFNDWQMHISPDISYTIWKYYESTGDWEYIIEHGAEVLFDIAQFLVSFVYYKKDKNRYECIRLLGPDEYHENVDNNAFTNIQSQYALDKAIRVYDMMQETDPAGLQVLMDKLQIDDSAVYNWREVCELMYIPQPDEDTDLIEQFDGYFQLEDTTPEVLANRLKDPGEYWGWPNGVAVETQVLKQADVIQLMALHPHRYDRETMKRNYEYYEPRTQHGSSLSPSVHNMVCTKIGHLEEAYWYFIKSCTVDLFNTNKAVSGGTFIGGIHTAACGIAWQLVVHSFCGINTHEGIIYCNPHLPKEWKVVEFSFKYRGNKLRFHINPNEAKIEAETKNPADVIISCGEKQKRIKAGETRTIKYYGS